MGNYIQSHLYDTHTHTKRQCFRITLSTAISALEKAGYWQSCLSMIARTALSIVFLPTQDVFFSLPGSRKINGVMIRSLLKWPKKTMGFLAMVRKESPTNLGVKLPVFGPSCRMPDLHLKPSIAAYGAAMSACDAAAAWSNAISLLDEMLLLGAAVFVFKRENTGESDDYENV